MSWKTLDAQFHKWQVRLLDEIKVPKETASKLATTIAAEVRFLDTTTKQEIVDASPVELSDRLEELQAFQGWMDLASEHGKNPVIRRAQVICQNYICFVYLPEACFKVLSKKAPAGSATQRCARFLTDNPIRAFRNALAHGNWCYRRDFSAIEYWARKGDNPNEAMSQFEVVQEDLYFWQALSRCIAYASYSNL